VRGKITVLDRARLTTWSQRLSPVSPVTDQPFVNSRSAVVIRSAV
jgi:hypothetical protein